MSAARTLVVGLAGESLTAAERAWLERWQPAGVILFARQGRDVARCRALIDELRTLLPGDGEICVDHEGGAVSFLAGVVGFAPAPWTLGDLDDPGLTERVHRELGARLWDLGITRVLGPCCDVLTEQRNPVIGARSFGADSARVIRHVTAAVGGLAAAGLKTCAKHWPGHGGTTVDTHDRVAEAAGTDPAPFLAASEAGTDALMIGHLPLAAGRLPLTLDRPALADLRADLGPIGLWADDVSMGALRPAMADAGVSVADGRTTGLVDPGQLPRAWIESLAMAGCERLLLRGIPWTAYPLDRDAGPEPSIEPLSSRPLRSSVMASPSARETWQRAVTRLEGSYAGPRLLWFDATADDRLGTVGLTHEELGVRWPAAVRLEAATPYLADTTPHGQILVTSHRPLTMAQAALLEPLVAATGEALVAGHPSLGDDVGRLLGPGWRIDRLFGLSADDLRPWWDRRPA